VVTGANGLFGAKLIHELIQSGVGGKSVCPAKGNLKGLEDVECEVHRGNILSFDGIHDALRDCNAVIDAASANIVCRLNLNFIKRLLLIPLKMSKPLESLQ